MCNHCNHLSIGCFTVILQDGERRIAVQYSQKVVGRRSYGGQSTNIPLKVNTAGVIPIIFSSSLMQFPIVIATFLGKDNGSGIGSEILRGLNQSNWCNPEQIKYSWGLVLYIVLTVFFAYFYTSITFNPLEIARRICFGWFSKNNQDDCANGYVLDGFRMRNTIPQADGACVGQITPTTGMGQKNGSYAMM